MRVGTVLFLGQAVEFDLDDAIPKLQLLGDKQQTFGIQCFGQVIGLGSVDPVRPCGPADTALGG